MILSSIPLRIFSSLLINVWVQFSPFDVSPSCHPPGGWARCKSHHRVILLAEGRLAFLTIVSSSWRKDGSMSSRLFSLSGTHILTEERRKMEENPSRGRRGDHWSEGISLLRSYYATSDYAFNWCSIIWNITPDLI
jgi:hypothetical protein